MKEKKKESPFEVFSGQNHNSYRLIWVLLSNYNELQLNINICHSCILYDGSHSVCFYMSKFFILKKLL